MPRPRLANRILGLRYGRLRCRLLPLFLPPVVYRRCLLRRRRLASSIGHGGRITERLPRLPALCRQRLRQMLDGDPVGRTALLDSSRFFSFP